MAKNFKQAGFVVFLFGAALGASALAFAHSVAVFRPSEAIVAVSSLSLPSSTGELRSSGDEMEALPASELAGNIAAAARESSSDERDLPAPNHAKAGGEWVEMTAAVNMRVGPSSGTRIIKVQQAGTRLRLTSRNNDWVEVEAPDSGEAGWIYSKFAAPIDAPRQSADLDPR